MRTKKKSVSKSVPSAKMLALDLDEIILRLMRLEDLFKRVEVLYCNPVHFDETLGKVRDLRLTYMELKEFYEHTKRK